MHGMLILTVLISGPATQKADPELQAEVEARITIVERWASEPIVVQAVREANENMRSMSEIEQIDTRWQETRGVDDFIRSIIDHPAAQRLRELRSANPELQEAFLTDRLGRTSRPRTRPRTSTKATRRNLPRRTTTAPAASTSERSPETRAFSPFLCRLAYR